MKTINFNLTSDAQVITSTKLDGYSEGKYSSLNLSYNVKDKRENVDKNRALFFSEIGMKQDKTMIMSKELCPVYPIMYSKDKTVVLGVEHSDTVPLFFYSKNKKIIGVMLVGFKELAGELPFQMIKHVMKEESVRSDDLFIYIAPCLTFSHYKIKKFLAIKYAAIEPFKECIKLTNGVYYFDQIFCATKQLIKAGIPFENINQSKYCTFENDDLFFSMTKKTPTGKMISVIKFNS